MLSGATFDQLMELPEAVQPGRTNLYNYERKRGEITWSLLHNIGGVDWEGLTGSGNIILRVMVQM